MTTQQPRFIHQVCLDGAERDYMQGLRWDPHMLAYAVSGPALSEWTEDLTGVHEEDDGTRYVDGDIVAEGRHEHLRYHLHDHCGVLERARQEDILERYETQP